MSILSYFNEIVSAAREATAVNVPIYISSLRGVVGQCTKIYQWDGEVIARYIEIDRDYIAACYYGHSIRYSPYDTYSLIDTVCHEIAHLYYWQHGEDHSKLTDDLFQKTVVLIQDL